MNMELVVTYRAIADQYKNTLKEITQGHKDFQAMVKASSGIVDKAYAKDMVDSIKELKAAAVDAKKTMKDAVEEGTVKSVRKAREAFKELEMQMVQLSRKSTGPDSQSNYIEGMANSVDRLRNKLSNLNAELRTFRERDPQGWGRQNLQNIRDRANAMAMGPGRPPTLADYMIGGGRRSAIGGGGFAVDPYRVGLSAPPQNYSSAFSQYARPQAPWYAQPALMSLSPQDYMLAMKAMGLSTQDAQQNYKNAMGFKNWKSPRPYAFVPSMGGGGGGSGPFGFTGGGGGGGGSPFDFGGSSWENYKNRPTDTLWSQFVPLAKQFWNSPGWSNPLLTGARAMGSGAMGGAGNFGYNFGQQTGINSALASAANSPWAQGFGQLGTGLGQAGRAAGYATQGSPGGFNFNAMWAGRNIGGGLGTLAGAGLSTGIKATTGALQGMGNAVWGVIGAINPLNPILSVLHSRFLKIAVMSAVIGTAGAMVHHGLTSAMDYQDAVTSMSVMSGSLEKGKQLVDQVQQFSAASPFGQTDVLNSARMLHGFGISDENIMPTLKAIGQLTAAAGGGTERFHRLSLAIGEVFSKGFLTGEKLRQLANAGIGPKDLADASGMTVPKLLMDIRHGKADVEILRTALNSLTGEGGRYGGTMEKLMENARGRLSFIKNQMGLGLQTGGLKFFEGINKAGVWDIGDSWAIKFRMVTDEMDSWTKMGEDFRAILVAIETAAGTVWEVMKNISASFQSFSGDNDMSAFEKVAQIFASIPAMIEDIGLRIESVLLRLMSFIKSLESSWLGKVVGGMSTQQAGGLSAASLAAKIASPMTAFGPPGWIAYATTISLAALAGHEFTDPGDSTMNDKAGALWNEAGTHTPSAMSSYRARLAAIKAGGALSPAQKAYRDRLRAVFGDIGFITSQDGNRAITPAIEQWAMQMEQHQGQHDYHIPGLNSPLEIVGMLKGIRGAMQPQINAKFLDMQKALSQQEDWFVDHGNFKDAAKIRDQQTQMRLNFERGTPEWKGLDASTAGWMTRGIFEQLQSHFKDQLEVKQPRGLMAGSSEAQDAINYALINPPKKVEEEMRDILKLMLEEATENNRLNRAFGEALQKLSDKDFEVLTGAIKGGQ